MNVLVCDDHAVFGESLALVLGRANYHVTAVTRSIDEALAVLRRFAVDVCLLDVMFARADGAPDAAVPVGADAGAVARSTDTRHPSTAARDACGGTECTLRPTVRAPHPRTRRRRADSRCTRVRTQGLPHRRDRLDNCPSARRRSRHRLASVRHARAPGRGAERNAAPGRIPHARASARCSANSFSEPTRPRLAKTLGVSWTTARSHIQSVLTKLGMHSRLEAATSAVRHGIVSGASGEWLL